MILDCKFDHERKLIVETLRGGIRASDLIEHEKAKLSNAEHNDSYSVAVDIRDSNFIMTEEEKNLFYKFLKESTAEINMNRKCALITDKPNEVANSQLFKMRYEL